MSCLSVSIAQLYSVSYHIPNSHASLLISLVGQIMAWILDEDSKFHGHSTVVVTGKLIELGVRHVEKLQLVGEFFLCFCNRVSSCRIWNVD
ncbi:hypothetical protein V6N12_044326 [Hibiscus sabdariffa]|uniref:Uncharacterized protein n=1 Tax=Hibiscus sabdariffa TaxID=183260 RepID=A0ABR2DGY3_9ROSI